jgi:hypothetical protein
MIQFVCDSCSRVKSPQATWILGRAAEAVGVTSARREVTIPSAWDRERAVDPLAVHFCSLECKEKYVAELFHPSAATEEVIVERPVPSENIFERLSPTQKVIKRAKSRNPRPRKRAA